MKLYQIAIIAAAVLLMGLIILPVFNRWQFKRLPADQQVLAIMKQAKRLVFWKNISLCKKQTKNSCLSMGAQPGRENGYHKGKSV